MPPPPVPAPPHDGLQNRPSYATADNSGNGIADRPQTLVLQSRARDIAADRTADCFNN